MQHLIGVYRISIGPFFYFGSSKNLKKRISAHLCRLRSGKHNNRFMQRAYSKHQTFRWKLIKICPLDRIIPFEQKFLTRFASHPSCLNSATVALSPFSCPLTIAKTVARNKSMTWTDDMRRKISLANTGRKASLETRAAYSKQRIGTLNSNSKLSEDDEKAIIAMRKSGVIVADLAKKFNVHETTISRLCSLKGVFHKPKSWSDKQRSAIMEGRSKNKNWNRRNVSGTKNPRCKLSEDDVKNIIQLLAEGISGSDLSKQFKVTKETIYSIKSGRNWPHLKRL